MKKINIVIICLITSFITLAQSNKNWNIAKPLDQLILVSTFGEIRTNHFHSGLDFSGRGKKGDPIYAIDNGYISKIKVSANGYGNAIYIIHPNGKKSVYGHLDRFANEIQNLVVKEQYKRQQFELDLYLEPETFKINKGQIIGYVGNTGYSYGPHLHFEIRNAFLDFPINALKFFPWIKDNVPPKIIRYAIYPATDTSFVNYKQKKIILPSSNKKIIHTYGPIYFGIETYDYINNHYSRKGVYDVKIFIDDSLWMWYRFDKILFKNSKDVNTLIDYASFINNNFKIQRTLITPGNRLCIYRVSHNRGIFIPNIGLHKIKYVISDFHGNKTYLTFYIKALAKKPKAIKKYKYKLINYGQEFRLDTNKFTLIIPDSALYDSIHFNFSIETSKNAYSPIYNIQNYQTPLRYPIKLIFTLPQNTTELNKFLIVYIDHKGNKQSLKTHIKSSHAIAYSYKFGKFYLSRDTIKPQIKAITPLQLSFGQRLIFKIKDNFGKIKNYKVIVNRKWTLFGYDAKTSTLSTKIDTKHFVKGPNHVAVYITDLAGNTKKRDFLLTVK